MKLKLKMSMNNDKEMFNFCNYFTKSEYHDDSNKSANGKRNVMQLKNLLD